MLNKAPINKIIELSTVDGPGLRTSIFVQKCNIHCLYCHNPETQNLCKNCLKCVSYCKHNALSIVDNKVIWNKDLCVNCDTCISICPFNASPKVLYLSASEVFESIKKNIGFIRGITVSGGECSLYPLFLTDLFKLAKEYNLSTLMDSNGMVLYEDYDELMKYTDGVMLDIKSWDNEVYKKLVGFDNEVVKKNLKYLNDHNKIEELRIVYVKDYVDAFNALDGIKSILKDKIKTTRIKLIAFRNHGVKTILKDKENTSEAEMKKLYDYAISLGYGNVVMR